MNELLAYWWAPLAWVVFAVLLWGATWIVYLANMAVLWATPVLYGHPAALAAVVPMLAAVMSTALNWLVFTVLLVELPKECFLSARLSRHKRHGRGWRQHFANWMGRTWLDPFDPSGHHI